MPFPLVQNNGQWVDPARLAASVTIPPENNVINVATGSAAPPDGSVARPFPTITAALAAASSGDVILVGPGTYVETVSLTTLDNITIRSLAGANNTTIAAPAGAGIDTVRFVPPAATTIDSFQLEGFRLVNGNAGGACLRLDGTATAIATIAQFLRVSCVIRDCPMTKNVGGGDAVVCVNTGPMVFQRGTLDVGEAANSVDIAGSVLLTNAGLVYFVNMSVGRPAPADPYAISYTYDDTLAATPFAGRQGVYLLDASACRGELILAATPLFVCDRTSAIFGPVTATALTTFVLGPLHAPVIAILGTIGLPAAGTTVTITLPPLVAAAPNFVDLSGTTLYGTAVLDSSALGVARNVVAWQGGRLAFSSIGPGSITAGADTDVDLRGSVVPQASILAVGNGAVDRDQFVVPAAALGGPTAIPIAPPFPLGATYNALFEAATPVSCGISAKIVAGFTATPSVAATIGFTVVRS